MGGHEARSTEDEARTAREPEPREKRLTRQTVFALALLVYAVIVLPPSIIITGTVPGIGAGVTALLLAATLWWRGAGRR